MKTEITIEGRAVTVFVILDTSQPAIWDWIPERFIASEVKTGRLEIFLINNANAPEFTRAVIWSTRDLTRKIIGMTIIRIMTITERIAERCLFIFEEKKR